MPKRKAESRSDQDQRVRIVLAFAQTISSRLETQPREATFAAELSSLLGSFPLVCPSAQSSEFDIQGTDIWNLSTRILHAKLDGGDGRIVCLLRVFACHLISTADKTRVESWNNAIRGLKIAIRAGKTCLHEKEFELCTKMLEMAATYLDKTKDMEGITPEDSLVRTRLATQNSLLRILLAWHQSKPQIAESLFNSLDKESIKSNAATSEEYADAFYEIGKLASSEKHFETAIQWLERALDILSEQDLGSFSDDAPDLKLSCMHLMTKCLLALSTSESKAKAANMLELMDKEYGDKMLVSLLKLVAISTDTQPDAVVYCGVLSRLMRSIYLTKPNFKTILHHIHKLRKIDRQSACQCLDEFLNCRLLPTGKMEHIERAVLMRLWIMTSDNSEGLEADIEQFLETIASNITTPISISATFAAQTLLWKRIETHFTAKEYEVAERLAELANHRLFENCGEGNRGKLLRKMMLCALARQDLSMARKHFDAMHATIQALPISRFLLYKVALRSNDSKLANECLSVIAKENRKDSSLLYACAIEAQQAGNRELIVQTLQNVVEQHQSGTAKDVNLPALLRCLIKVVKAEIVQKIKVDENLELVCQTLGKAASNAFEARTGKRINEDFTKDEVDWFARNCYNFILEHIADLNPAQLVGLSQTSILFIDALIAETDVALISELKVKRICCDYFAVIGHLVLARAADDIAASHRHYDKVSNHAITLCSQVQAFLAAYSQDKNASSLRSKHFEAVKHRLEAAIRTKQWNQLEALFAECWRYEDDVKQWDTLADLAFLLNEESLRASASQEQQEKILDFIRGVITRSISHHHTITNIARWLRCLFSLALLPNSTLALECVTHATALAAIASTVSPTDTEQSFPATELEWLAASAFNHAIDFYGAGDDENCHVWASAAVQLAQKHREYPGLADLLRSRLTDLLWRDE